MSFSPYLDTPLCSKHFVFLHEMGHILYNEITDGGASIPELFRKFATAIIEMPILADEDKLPELFADLSAAAVMFDSRYDEYNSYAIIFPKELTWLFEEYFMMLVSKAGSRYFGIGEKRVSH